MTEPYDLDRFLKAQANDYDTALNELKAGRKRNHWIWYVFPQVAGLGHSPTSQFYAIKSLDEAAAYLRHPILGGRLHECLKALQPLEQTSASQVFGEVDAMKFRSSLTLFSEPTPPTRSWRLRSTAGSAAARTKRRCSFSDAIDSLG